MSEEELRKQFNDLVNQPQDSFFVSWKKMEDSLTPEERVVTDKVKYKYIRNVSIGSALGGALGGGMVYKIRQYVPRSALFAQVGLVCCLFVAGGMSGFLATTESAFKLMLKEFPKDSRARDSLVDEIYRYNPALSRAALAKGVKLHQMELQQQQQNNNSK